MSQVTCIVIKSIVPQLVCPSLVVTWGCLQAVGDALSGVLMVEAALRRRQWGLEQWGQLYQDLPSRQSKVLVTDRGVISTINAETQVAAPAGLQSLIDQAVAGNVFTPHLIRDSLGCGASCELNKCQLSS